MAPVGELSVRADYQRRWREAGTIVWVTGSLDPSLILVSLDWIANVVTLHRADGAIGTAQLPREDVGWVPRIRSTTWSPPLDAVAFETTDGDHIAFELPRFDGADQL